MFARRGSGGFGRRRALLEMKTEDVIFKGTKQGLCVILPHDDDFVRVKGKLAAKLDSTSGFFAGATRAILDIGELALSENDTRELVGIIESFGVSVSRVVGGVGLSAIGRALPSQGAVGAPADAPQPPASSPAPVPGAERPASREVPGVGLPFAEEPSGATLLVRRTLRSGQRVAFAGNVVVLGDVNAGAEVVAGGDIVVVGALRGVAHAGTPDNKRAIVVALRLTPTQLRIADFIARPPDGDHKAPRSPEIARTREDAIVIEAYSARKAELEEELAWEER